MTWRLGRRRALDVLRGVAIILVLVGHADLTAPWAGSGTAGVSLFFALSGYLITGLLIGELADRGRVDLRAFYARRGRRLLPALAAFVTAMLVLRIAVPVQAVPVVLYFANIAKSSAFDLGPFAATWSLAVEEQFYLAWPAALLLALRGRPAWTLAIAVVLGLVGLPWAAALLGGSGVAMLARERGRDPVVPVLGLVAAAVGLAGLSFVPVATAGQSVMALLSVVVVAGVGSRQLTSRPLELTGRISYGMYLWHYPIAVALWSTALPWLARFGVLAVTSYAVAAVSWLLLERRFLRRRVDDGARIFGTTSVPGAAERDPHPSAADVLVAPRAG